MDPEITQPAGSPPAETPAETPTADPETVSLPKAEYEKLQQDLGSLKRENKDLKKAKDEPKEPATPDELIQKTYLRAANITAEDEVELALATAKKWAMPIDKLVDDEDFKGKLDKLRTQKANDLATSGIKGGPGSKSAMQTPEFYIARGTPPSADEVPDRKSRAEIARAMLSNAKNGKKFYNE